MLSILEVVGFMHYWGVTISGVSTIYILICVGLAVDYAAHIGHIFKDSVGTAADRAHDAMTRIGPSVFHAIFSTILAVMVLSASKSYVFRTFFQILFLVTFIAGAQGLWLLPTVLSYIGGDREAKEGDPSGGSTAPAEKKEGWDEPQVPEPAGGA
jgi:predicted RND superfamily exporter protein